MTAGFAAPGRVQIARAVPGGSIRARGPRLESRLLTALGSSPQLLALRADFRGHVLDAAKWLARSASWADGTTRPTRAYVCRMARFSLSTWKACRRFLERWGWLATVLEGSTEEFRPMGLADRSRPNEAAVYVLCIPKTALPSRQAADPPGRPAASASATTRPPTRTCSQIGPPSAGVDKPGTPENRIGAGFAGAVLPAMAAVMRQAARKPVSDKSCARIGGRFAAAGWTAEDLRWAIDHAPDGQQHRYGDDVRFPVSWLRWRLRRWTTGDGRVLPSHRQQLAVSRQQQRAAAARSRAERQAEAAVPAADAIAAAHRVRLLGLDRPATERPIVRWIEYATLSDHRARAGGVPRQGRVHQDGPGPGTVWVAGEDTGRLYELVHYHPDAPEANYALVTEQN